MNSGVAGINPPRWQSIRGQAGGYFLSRLAIVARINSVHINVIVSGIKLIDHFLKDAPPRVTANCIPKEIVVFAAAAPDAPINNNKSSDNISTLLFIWFPPKFSPNP